MTVQLDEAPAATDQVLGRSLADTDPAVFAAIADELTRQQSTLEMIASETSRRWRSCRPRAAC
jgi:glycine hydroxymethyltransferase